MTEHDPEQIEEVSSDRGQPRRDWFGRLLERLSRTSTSSEPDEERPRFTPPLIVALLALAVASGVTIGLIITSRGDETQLEATRMTLELTYPTTGEPTASLEGQPDAAPADARVTCRSTRDNDRLGDGRASGDGSFNIALDPAIWPLESISGDSYEQLNSTLECRSGTGPWVQPLRPPRVAIN